MFEKYIDIYKKKYINIQSKCIDIQNIYKYISSTSIFERSISIFIGSIFVRFARDN